MPLVDQRGVELPTPADPRGGTDVSAEFPDFAHPDEHVRMKLRDRRNHVLKVTGKLPSLPGVSALSIATRYIDGGRDRFIEYVQMAVLDGIAEATAFWVVFADLLPGERVRVSLDDVCAAAGVSPSALMGKIVSVAMQAGTDVGNLVAASMQPAIVHQAGRSAKRIGGAFAGVAQRDREMLFQHSNFIPLPRGQQIHVHASSNATAVAASNAVAADPSVPSFADTMAALRAPRNAVQSKLIEAHVENAAADRLLDDLNVLDAVAVREPVIVRTDTDRGER